MLEEWLHELGRDSFVAFMSRSGVAKLLAEEDDTFQNEMEYWRNKLGRDNKKKLRFAKLTPAMLIRLTTHNFAVGLGNITFQIRLDEKVLS